MELELEELELEELELLELVLLLEDDEEEDELDELELDDEPLQLLTTPPSPHWSSQVLVPIQLWLFSHPQPLFWF